MSCLKLFFIDLFIKSLDTLYISVAYDNDIQFRTKL